MTLSEAATDRLAEKGLAARALDISQPFGVPPGWEAPDVLVHCASSGRGGADAYRAVYRDGLANSLRAFRPLKVVFSGSTSVYAQTDGSWVDEHSPAEPERETGKILLEAERMALESGGIVLRFSGLYGPGRSVLVNKLLEGTAVLEGGGHRWINQIHRDDAAAALLRVSGIPEASGIFNATDDSPWTQRDCFSLLAEYFDRPLPPEAPENPGRKRGLTNKRVRNSRLRSLGWLPQYPSFRDALDKLHPGVH